MTIDELKAIVNNCETDPRKRVMVRVRMPGGSIADADIKSFGTYTDGLLLNVRIEGKAT